jgi:hypothetical protein
MMEFSACVEIYYRLFRQAPELIQVPFEKLPTGATEFFFLEIRIFNTGRGEHDASAVTAMNQPHTVAKFVNGRLPHPFQEQVHGLQALDKNGDPVFGWKSPRTARTFAPHRKQK